MKFKHQSGFSLLELAIALAVLAILTGGVLKGRELINTAKVQSMITELANLETAITAFESRYNALPGDFSAATAAGLGSGGDGDGLINTNDEIGSAWQHLALAGFIKGDFDGATLPDSEQCPPSTCLTSPLGGTIVISNLVNVSGLGEGRLVASLGLNHPASLIAEVDRKIDDGNPKLGSLRVTSNAEEQCVSSTGEWNEQENPSCRAVYLLR